ncbi:putative lipoprotein [compost metagenome]
MVVGMNRMKQQVDEMSRQNDSGLYGQPGRSERGNMAASRYRLQGSIASISKRADKKRDSYYLLNMELVDNQSGVIVWTDEKEIRKTTAKK